MTCLHTLLKWISRKYCYSRVNLSISCSFGAGEPISHKESIHA